MISRALVVTPNSVNSLKIPSDNLTIFLLTKAQECTIGTHVQYRYIQVLVLFAQYR